MKLIWISISLNQTIAFKLDFAQSSLRTKEVDMRNLPDLWREMDRPFASSLWNDLDRSLTAWRPMLRQLDDFFNEVAFGRSSIGEGRSIMPSIDLDERDDYYLLNFDMPGLDKKDIDIEVQGNRLAVTGERKQEREVGEGQSRFSEQRYRRFERSVTLPMDVKIDNVEAEYQNGVLTVVVPKSAESKRQHIKIGEGKSGIVNKLLSDTSKKDSKKTLDVKESNQASAH